ncbi:unnamed protein product [Caenorhabditis angaria]|uniref:Uncharacterized protein n=1 Tax=Caenorhabditis angaria TaxID=860376 RepID=A0A9P1ICS4_9PELO|nr:unnamed protein product [Caenorhabditis angaria]
MSNEKLKEVYSNHVTEILRTIGNSAASFSELLGNQSLDIAILNVEAYLIMLKGLREDVASKSPLTVVKMSPIEVNRNVFSDVHQSPNATIMLQEETVIDETREMDDSMNDRGFLADDSEDGIDSLLTIQNESRLQAQEESTFFDETREMNDSVNDRGFLADVSSNCERRSRQPSFNFDSILSVQESRLPSSFEFEHETPIFSKMIRGEIDQSVIVVENTPKPQKSTDVSTTTPPNLWNVQLRPGSNRRISEEIRQEIQRQFQNAE